MLVVVKTDIEWKKRPEMHLKFPNRSFNYCLAAMKPHLTLLLN